MLIAETDSAGTPQREYIYNGMSPVAQIDSELAETINYLHTDHLYTPRFATNSVDEITWRWEGDAFGTAQAEEVATVVNLRFPGQYFDEETNLHYNHFRYYDPETGRYVQSDRIGLNDGTNTYLYAQGNPLTYIDSNGLFAVNPATVKAVELLINTAAAIFLSTYDTSDSSSDSKTDESKECKTCSNLYPNYVKCSSISNHRYNSKREAYLSLGLEGTGRIQKPRPISGGLVLGLLVQVPIGTF